MPKTKLQSFIFTLMMAFIMVYAMICYNIALAKGTMSNQVFVLAFQEMLIMYPIAILLEFFIVERCATYITFRLVDEKKDSPRMIRCTLCSIIVCLMCPVMSLIATLLFKQAGSEWIAIWLQTTVFNFPMALAWQIFFGGALIRLFFKKVMA